MKGFKSLKLACYSANISMSAISAMSPLLFVTFRTMYGISYSLLGTLVLVNFATQLLIDLIFSFFSHKFNIERVIKLTPLITFSGMLIYALSPLLFPSNVYLGLLLGTLLFAVSGGLCEVLISPIIAAIPAENPEREMSKLHSVYAWGVVAVVILSSLFLYFAGSENWQYLSLLLSLIPLASLLLFWISPIPDLGNKGEKSSLRSAISMFKNKNVILFVAVMFMAGATEAIMSQWCPGYLERSSGIDKIWGDIFGLAMFSAMLGLGRTLYAKFGKSIYGVLLWGALGCTLCYISAAMFTLPLIGLISCALTGFCVSMLWPGSLIAADSNISGGGVFIYAIMAAGGDLGGAFAPQLVGIITDASIASPAIARLASSLAMTPEQLGMKLAILVGAVFPLCATLLFAVVKGRFDKKRRL